MNNQPDFFCSNEVDYLFSELNKHTNSSNRQFRAIFALLAELKENYNELKGVEKKTSKKKNAV